MRNKTDRIFIDIKANCVSLYQHHNKMSNSFKEDLIYNITFAERLNIENWHFSNG